MDFNRREPQPTQKIIEESCSTMMALTLESLSLMIDDKLRKDYGKKLEGIVFILEGGLEMRLLVPKVNEIIERKHSDDYRTILWDGRQFKFTGMQAAAIRLLWESENQELSQDFILETINSDSQRLRDVFKNNDAWGIVIVPSDKKGMFRLS